jgi:hypothetical protein
MNSQSLVIAVLNETLTSGPTWDIETVDTTDGTDHVGIYSALALDGDDKAHVAYAVYGQEPFTPSYPKYLKYATNQSGSWTFDFPAPGEEAGFYNSITLDTDNRPHISYFDRGSQAVKYVYWDGASWHRETVASGVFIQGLPGIQLDENNQPYIAYCDIFSNTVRVARLVTQEHQMYLPQAWD